SDPSKIVGISVKTSEGTTTMEKTGEKWLITGPVSARANMPAVDAIVREMSNITAGGFTKLKKTDARLDQPVATVTIQVEQGNAATQPEPGTHPATQSASKPATSAVTLLLGVYTDISKKAAVYASMADSETVFTLRTESFNQLDKEL